jgi:hypothetical protein
MVISGLKTEIVARRVAMRLFGEQALLQHFFGPANAVANAQADD